MKVKWYQMIVAVVLTSIIVGGIVSVLFPLLGQLIVLGVVFGLSPLIAYKKGELPFIKEQEEEKEATGPQTPVDELRQQYMEGKITDAEFEERMDELMQDKEQEREMKVEREF